eukprot:CAMPEP_0168514746 /NCGR_PEP_ID=MMETSP0405-20121227/4304_1 /TAXON_ID=498012 /ORGANISM="Trichosphaerium sp, Strain Am-I-7 wt" /LENGTH=266 /DNA_ID=CAMNT_0008533953 /DNA_START=45 /DNA_END=845 /DNA_ORIENTATION=-
MENATAVVVDFIDNWELNKETTFGASFYFPVYASIGYLVVMYGLQYLLKGTKPLKLTFIFFLHNIFLSLWSLLMLVGTLVTLVKYYKQDGWEYLNCDPENKYAKGALAFWSYSFYLSKYYEWFDTLFLVLKQKDLIFLHVYHHVIMAFVGWSQMETGIYMVYEPMVANTFVHTIMYMYYGLTTLGYRFWWRKYLTQIQIIQFIGLLVGCAYPKMYPNLFYGKCNHPNGFWSLAFGWYAVFTIMLLFFGFYYRNYSSKKAQTEKKTQ